MKDARTSSHLCRSRVLLAAAVFTAWHVASAAASTTWSVGTNGIDSPSCGKTTTPCRSIGQALNLAAAGDTIAVGAGTYGDLNRDGAFTLPGEEQAENFRGGNFCMICINKAVKIVSLHGPKVTIIDAGDAQEVAEAVHIGAPGVTFSGFTVRHTLGNAVGVQFPPDVTITNNILSGNRDYGIGFIVDTGAPGNNYIQNNVVSDNGRGGIFIEYGIAIASPGGVPAPNQALFISGNVVNGNGSAGVSIIQVIAGPLINFQITNNIVSDNGDIGVVLAAPGVLLQNNTITANHNDGVFLEANGARITGNTLIGNAGAGVRADSINGAVIEANNIYGNLGLLSLPSPGNTSNCGIVNTGLAAATPAAVDAKNNFWGTARGPGPEPADNAAGSCDFNNGHTVVTPFSASGFTFAPATN